jgi:hypothetical protein
MTCGPMPSAARRGPNLSPEILSPFLSRRPPPPQPPTYHRLHGGGLSAPPPRPAWSHKTPPRNAHQHRLHAQARFLPARHHLADHVRAVLLRSQKPTSFVLATASTTDTTTEHRLQQPLPEEDQRGPMAPNLRLARSLQSWLSRRCDGCSNQGDTLDVAVRAGQHDETVRPFTANVGYCAFPRFGDRRCESGHTASDGRELHNAYLNVRHLRRRGEGRDGATLRQRDCGAGPSVLRTRARGNEQCECKGDHVAGFHLPGSRRGSGAGRSSAQRSRPKLRGSSAARSASASGRS